MKKALLTLTALAILSPGSQALAQDTSDCSSVVCVNSKFFDQQNQLLLLEYAAKTSILEAFKTQKLISTAIADNIPGDKNSKSVKISAEVASYLSITLGSAIANTAVEHLSPWLVEFQKIKKEQISANKEVRALKKVVDSRNKDLVERLAASEARLIEANNRMFVHMSNRGGIVSKLGRLSNKAVRLTIFSGAVIMMYQSTSNVFYLTFDSEQVANEIMQGLENDKTRLEAILFN